MKLYNYTMDNLGREVLLMGLSSAICDLRNLDCPEYAATNPQAHRFVQSKLREAIQVRREIWKLKPLQKNQ